MLRAAVVIHVKPERRHSTDVVHQHRTRHRIHRYLHVAEDLLAHKTAGIVHTTAGIAHTAAVLTNVHNTVGIIHSCCCAQLVLYTAGIVHSWYTLQSVHIAAGLSLYTRC